MKTNFVIDISPPIPYLTKFWFLSSGPKCCQPIKLQDSLKIMKFIFGMQINRVFYKLTLSFWVCVTRHVKSTQNKKFAYLQYLHKSMWDEVDFLPADKHKSFLQVDSITLGVCNQTHPKYAKQQVYNIFAISQGKREG